MQKGNYMRAKDIELGKHYRLIDTPNYGWIKVLRVMNIKEMDKTKNFLVVKCEHTINKDDSFGFIRYFRPRDIIEG